MVARVLIANRGEIARRIIRTCRELGVATVAVHSDADADEPHVREADVAVRLGPAPAPSSYLDRGRVLDAARRTGCDAVHPGYGFLAEDPAFARAVTDAGLTFVGPSAEVIALMGDKSAAKRRLKAAGLPVVPGEDRADLDDATLLSCGEQVGFPLVVKAVAGGGGTGMRVVTDPQDLAAALVAARREARGAFGDDRLILERLVTRPRHIEVQVLADGHGNVVHLFERECSVQRRHQKLVEEAPSPAVGQRLRSRLGEAAVTASREVGYLGAGTLEFLVDGTTIETGEPRFYFLEMNTRLQVEHPVTELVTGLDLVALQLAIADGEPLPVRQDELTSTGHAIEVRLYAEDPVDHLPQTGTVHALRLPTGPGVRCDVGIASGSEVTRYYDPMVGKLIAHGPDRATAISRLRAALASTSVRGVVTNVELLDAVLAHPAFAAGDLTTSFLDEHLPGWHPEPLGPAPVAAAGVALHDAGCEHDAPSPWARIGALRTGGGSWRLALADRIAAGGDPHRLQLTARGSRTELTVDGQRIEPAQLGPDDLEVATGPDGVRHVWLHHGGRTRVLDEVPPVRHADASAPIGAATFTAPMPGTVIAVEVAAGSIVAAGATLVIVEAMKMEHPVRAPVAGTVTAVHVHPGQGVDTGTTLVAFEPGDTSEAATAAGA